MHITQEERQSCESSKMRNNMYLLFWLTQFFCFVFLSSCPDMETKGWGKQKHMRNVKRWGHKNAANNWRSCSHCHCLCLLDSDLNILDQSQCHYSFLVKGQTNDRSIIWLTMLEHKHKAKCSGKNNKRMGFVATLDIPRFCRVYALLILIIFERSQIFILKITFHAKNCGRPAWNNLKDFNGKLFYNVFEMHLPKKTPIKSHHFPAFKIHEIARS